MPGWVQLAIETAIPWPDAPTSIQYLGREIELAPATPDNYALVSMKLMDREKPVDGQRFLQRFLSALCWTERLPARVAHVGGGGMKIKFGRDRSMGTLGGFHLRHAPTSLNETQALALALYREAKSLQSAAYSFLSYYKIVNLLHSTGSKQIAWINASIGRLPPWADQARAHALRNAGEDIGAYLYKSCRCAVAHAGTKPVVDPDDPADRRRLEDDLSLICALVEYLIEVELGVKSLRTIFREHLYELVGFKEVIGSAVAARLMVGEAVPPVDVPTIPRISIGLLGHPPFEPFTDLTASPIAATAGVLVLACTTQDSGCEVRLGLDFRAERLIFNPLNARLADDGSTRPPRLAAAVQQYWRALFLNGAIVIRNAVTGEELGHCDAYVPMNVDSRATLQMLDQRIAECEAEEKRRSADGRAAHGPLNAQED